MPSIKSLKTQDFINLQDNLYRIMEIVSQHEGIYLEASYPLRDIKTIIDDIGNTNIGIIARESQQRSRHGRSRKEDVVMTYKQKLEMALDPNDKFYKCCEKCGEPVTIDCMWVHQRTAKCQHNYNRIKAGRCIKDPKSKLIDIMIPIISDLEDMLIYHQWYHSIEDTPYYHKYMR